MLGEGFVVGKVEEGYMAEEVRTTVYTQYQEFHDSSRLRSSSLHLDD